MYKIFIKTLLPSILLLSLSYSVSGQVTPVTRYIDATGGNDVNNGLSAQSAWKSLANINSSTFNPGDSILLKAGEVWTGSMVLKGSGNENNPIRIDRYGTGDNPVINGTGGLYTIYLYNREYWELSNLEITNFKASEETVDMETWEANNKTVWAESVSPRPQYEETRSRKCAILVEASNYGAVHHLHFTNLEIHGVNGDISSKDNGGIFLEIKGSSTETWFDDLLFENCHIHDVDRTGISNKSRWDDRSLYINENWVPSKNVRYLENTFERTGANALIIRVTDAALVENNLFTHCSIKETGNAFFPFNCDDILIQYNESCHTKYNQGDNDAGGFDSDYRCKNSIFQYNYSHDNEYGGILITCQGGSDRFNDGTIVRYNLFRDNKRHVFRVSGVPTNTYIYNNVIYTGEGNSDNDIIWHKNWKGYPDNTNYYNNIFYNLGTRNAYDFGSSTDNVFENNIFFGNPVTNEPSDPNKITEDPKFVDPGSEDVKGYKIQDSSPAKAAGKIVFGKPDKDFFGNSIPPEGPVDIGIHQWSKPLSDWGRSIDSRKDNRDAISLFPNPVHDNLTVYCADLPAKAKKWRVIDSKGMETGLKNRIDPVSETFSLDINFGGFEIEAGIYFVSIILESGLEVTHPFIYY